VEREDRRVQASRLERQRLRWAPNTFSVIDYPSYLNPGPKAKRLPVPRLGKGQGNPTSAWVCRPAAAWKSTVFLGLAGIHA
jgi:hypothetical protein